MIQAIAVDLGGVLFSGGKKLLYRKLTQKYSYDSAIIQSLLSSRKAWQLYRGLISARDFWNWMQSKLPVSYDAQIIRQLWYDSYMLDRDLLKLLRKVRKRYPLIVFSGNIKERVLYLDKKYHFRKHFDYEVYSYDCHAVKPDKKFLFCLLKKSGLKPSEILYLDDSVYDTHKAVPMGFNVFIYNKGLTNKLFQNMKKLGIDIN